MTTNRDKIDWSSELWKDRLIFQRKSLWLDDTVKNLAGWFGMKPGMSVIDIGCGLGYLGYTYWPYFGKGGYYIGVDISYKLLKNTANEANKWAINGKSRFISGDIYNLPLSNNLADIVMCQTLFIHLKDPERALSEMIRVVKPGGLIVCKEPDNLSFNMGSHFSSLPEFDMEEKLFLYKVSLIRNKGRIKLGRGDNNIAPKIPNMMSRLGLQKVDARINDKVSLLQPPYETIVQQHGLNRLKKDTFNSGQKKLTLDKLKEEFFAGGGDKKDYEHYVDIYNRFMYFYREQIEKGEFYWCFAISFYIIKGNKPE